MAVERRRSENTKKVSISVSPWTDKVDSGKAYFSLVGFHIKEAVYGEVPEGSIELIHSGFNNETKKETGGDFNPRTLINTQETGVVEIIDGKEEKGDRKKGLTYTFSIFITKRQYVNNLLTLGFIVIPVKKGEQENIEGLKKGKNFYTALYSETYPSLESTIETIWPGEKNITSRTNVSDQVKIYRDNETSYSLLCRLGKSWKINTVFAIGWDGLVIKDLMDGINSFGNSEANDDTIERVYGDNEEWIQVSYHTLRYNKHGNYNKLYNTWQDPYKDTTDINKSVTPDDWYKEVEPKHPCSTITDRLYRIQRKEYEVLAENKDWNDAFSGICGYSDVTIVAQEMPRQWKLGDIIMYERRQQGDGRNDVEPARFLVASNELFFSQNGSSCTGPHGFPFEWTTVLWSIEKKAYNEELEDNKDNKE